MAVSTQLHLAAGIGALVMGIACLLADPERRRNRLFALLCFAMALWTLGLAAVRSDLPMGPRDLWGIRLFLLGSCAAAPLGLHFALVLCWPRRQLPRLLLAAAYSASGGLWLSTWLYPDLSGREWKLAAILVLGSILAVALALLARKCLALPPGPERRAYRIVTLAAILAAVGGLSDFVPRGELLFPKLGPVTLILFILAVSGVVLRHRFLDLDRFLAQAAAVISGAGVFALVLYGSIRLFGDRFLTLFVLCLAALFLMPSIGRLIMAGTRELLAKPGPLAAAFTEVSQKLPEAETPDRIWEILDEGRRNLPEQTEITLFLRDEAAGCYRPHRFRREDQGPGETGDLALNHPVPGLLAADRTPLHPRILEEEIREAEGARLAAIEEVLAWSTKYGFRLLVPVLSDEVLRGWIGVRGIPRNWITADLAASIHAVGNQAIASLDRLEALEAAKRRRALAAVGEMAAGLAHEVRNPLAAIRGAAQALNPDASPEQAREMLAVIDEESDRLGRVVGEFLEYARPASPRREAVDLSDTARRVARDAGLAGFALAVRVHEPDGPVSVSADPDQVRRAFENLVRNAWEAAGAGGELDIYLGTTPEGAPFARFSDNGPGIPEELLPNLFQPFVTTRSRGTGLGLALVHRVMDAHRGTVEASNRPDGGATFTLLFRSHDVAHPDRR